jgi:hypothetical protein
MDINWSGSSTVNVNGASGICSVAQGVIVFIASGGTAPYAGNGPGGADTYVTGDPSGKISLAASPDGIHNTLAWSGFALNEFQSCVIRAAIHDAAGHSASDSAPASGAIILKRTS